LNAEIKMLEHTTKKNQVETLKNQWLTTGDFSSENFRKAE